MVRIDVEPVSFISLTASTASLATSLVFGQESGSPNVVEKTTFEDLVEMIKGDYTFSPNPVWIRILEFYCPGCGTQLETEYLPPGHPITHDIEVDIDSLKARLAKGDIVIKNGKLVKPNKDGAAA